MSDFLKLALDATGDGDCWREIEAVEVTLRLSRTVEIDNDSQAVTISYRREVVQVVKGAGSNVTIIDPSQDQKEEDDQTCASSLAC